VTTSSTGGRRFCAGRLILGAVLCAVAVAPSAAAKGPRYTVENGDVRYTLNQQHETSLAERSRTGTLLRHLPVPGSWAFPVANDRAQGLSRNGAVLVLVQAPSPALSSRSNSRFAIVDVRRLRVMRVVRLPGRLEFVAISGDGTRVMLAAHDVVRVLDVRSGRLVPMQRR
jgi:hypothetical protein